MCLGWKEHGLEVFDTVYIVCLRTDQYWFYQLNECANTIQDDTGAIGLIRVPQLELTLLNSFVQCAHASINGPNGNLMDTFQHGNAKYGYLESGASPFTTNVTIEINTFFYTNRLVPI